MNIPIIRDLLKRIGQSIAVFLGLITVYDGTREALTVNNKTKLNRTYDQILEQHKTITNVELNKVKDEATITRSKDFLDKFEDHLFKARKSLQGIKTDGNLTSTDQIQKSIEESQTEIHGGQAILKKMNSLLNHSKFRDDNDWLNTIYIEAQQLYFDYLNFLTTISTLQKLALGHMLLFIFILLCLSSIISIIYGDMLLIYFKIEEKYPKIGRFIKLRRKFQKYYLFLNLLSIILVLLFLLYINFLLFTA